MTRDEVMEMAVVDKIAHGLWANLGGEAKAPTAVCDSLGLVCDEVYEGGTWHELPSSVRAWWKRLVVDVLVVDGGIDLSTCITDE